MCAQLAPLRKQTLAAKSAPHSGSGINFTLHYIFVQLSQLTISIQLLIGAEAVTRPHFTRLIKRKHRRIQKGGTNISTNIMSSKGNIVKSKREDQTYPSTLCQNVVPSKSLDGGIVGRVCLEGKLYC